MLQFKINLYQGTSQGEVIALGKASEAKFKFIGELDGDKAVKGAVFQIVSPTEKLLVWNGTVSESGVESFFRKSGLQDKISRKLQGTKIGELERTISSLDRFVFTNSDVISVGGNEFSFEGLLTILDVRKVLIVKGRMVVEKNDVQEVSDVEIYENDED